MLLWFFAGFIVYVAIFLVIIFELMLSAYLCFKSGWFDSLDTGIIVEFSSGIADTSDALGAMTNSSAAWMGAASEDETVYYQIAAVISIAFTVLSIILVFLWKTQVSTLTPIPTPTPTLSGEAPHDALYHVRIRSSNFSRTVDFVSLGERGLVELVQL